jgi:hypothetical protein
MPLCTAIYDADTTTRRKLPHGWGWWHVEVITDIARREGGMSEDTPLLTVWSINGGHHTVQHGVSYQDPEDGERITFWPGDELEVWRE